MDVSVVNEIAGMLERSILNLPINSAAMCCASAALPPLPNKITLPSFFNEVMIFYKNKKNHLCHTLNGSALALPRILASILENNQIDNKITIPEVLHEFCGFSEIS